MSRIRDLRLRRVFDSRGAQTVEAILNGGDGVTASIGAPSGASTGRHEARAFPEGGVAVAIQNFEVTVRPRIVGLDFEDQELVDATLHEVDGTPDFSRIGGNVATAISLVSATARACAEGRPLAEIVRRAGVARGPTPMIVGNCLNGGRHAIGGPDIQEFHAISKAGTPEQSILGALAVHREVGSALEKKHPGAPLGRGDEGGWVAGLGNLEALEVLEQACDAVRDRLQVDVHPGLDFAASEFCRDGRYRYREQTLDQEGQVGFVAGLVDKFHRAYVEDPLEEEAFDGFAELTKAVGSRCLVVGDDLYTTRRDRLAIGIGRHSTNSILIKVNQVGTLTDTLATVDLARSRGVETVVSHRSGDLPEGWLAHLAVGFGSSGIKCGLLGGERVAKLNELMRLGAAPS